LLVSVGIFQPLQALVRFGQGGPKTRFRNVSFRAPHGLDSPMIQIKRQGVSP